MRFYPISSLTGLTENTLNAHFNQEILCLGLKETDSIVKSVSYKCLFYETNIVCVIAN